ncbi:hypothetical protein [Nitritalea halalkaliphila]|uniref:hypothetical protein n=1 Tax=Nitritalea halalkaliphila TaxID=590849 RepID=UPI000307C487|nr:hypothetical protein [Nitritalea halalkaliphila]
MKIQRNADGQLLHYEEVFRTWKFEEEELLEKGLFLFDRMVRGEDLTLICRSIPVMKSTSSFPISGCISM